MRVQSSGKRLFTKNFVIVATAGKTSHARIGITVSKKVDKRAVIRNRIKRLLREVFRRKYQELKENYDFVVIARQKAGDCTQAEVFRQVYGAWQYHDFLRPKL